MRQSIKIFIHLAKAGAKEIHQARQCPCVGPGKSFDQSHTLEREDAEDNWKREGDCGNKKPQHKVSEEKKVPTCTWFLVFSHYGGKLLLRKGKFVLICGNFLPQILVEISVWIANYERNSNYFQEEN